MAGDLFKFNHKKKIDKIYSYVIYTFFNKKISQTPKEGGVIH